MQMGEIIRKYRKRKNLTQEEMALRLGVTAPAVNKWENGNSLPDILLLAPIARLLGITTDELLSFRVELTKEEIGELLDEADRRLREESYEAAFAWAGKMLEEYPNCEELVLQTAALLDGGRLFRDVPDSGKYDDTICAWYVRALESGDETIRQGAADSLFAFYVRKEEYEKAEQCLEYFSGQNPEKKRKQAQIYSETGRLEEAYQAYEELLFAEYQVVSASLQGLYQLALKENNLQKAHLFADKQSEAARCFEMGKYRETACQLEIAAMEKNRDAVLAIMEEMLSSAEDINSFCRSPLYEHMKFKEVREDFLRDLKSNLQKCFQDEETFGFLKAESQK